MSDKRANANRAHGWKIDIRQYFIKVPVPDGRGGIKEENGLPVYQDEPFDVQGSLCAILFNHDLKLGPEDSFKAHDLAEKIRAATDFVVLDNDEMKRIREAYAILKGPSENMIPFLKRIRDAEQIELQEASEAKENDNVA